MISYPYIIIDDNPESILETKAMAGSFQNLNFIGSADNYEDGLNMVLEYNPTILFLEISPENEASNLSLRLIDALHRFLKVLPKIIITTKGKDLAFDALKYEVFDYLIKPLQITEFRKTVLKYEKAYAEVQFFEPAFRPDNSEVLLQNKPEAKITSEIILPIVEQLIDEPKDISEKKPLTICVKSYGDYRFINADDICYLQADNNSTDIHLNNGEMITAFKTLKHFETVLESPFVRIHNSYIVNIDYVSRIHTGNAVCYIKNTTIKLPFSKSYKENVDAILNSITKGNYLEI